MFYSTILNRTNSKRTAPVAGGGSSILQTAAAGMSSGQWLQMTGGNLPTGLDLFTDLGGAASGGSSGFCVAYCEKFARDSVNKKFYFAGSDHFEIPNPANAHGLFLQYDEATNAWSFVVNTPWGVSPGAYATPNHGYSGSTFDGTTFWHHPPYGTDIRDWGGSSFGTASLTGGLSNTSATGCAEWFPERSRIMIAQVENVTDATLAEFNTSTRTASSLVDHTTGTITGFGGYSVSIWYSSVRARVFFGGGNGSNRIWSVNSSGTVTRHDDCPVNFGPGGPNSSHLFINPSNGNPIVYTSSTTWRELNIDATAGSQWSSKGGTVDMLSSNTYDGSAYGTMAATTEYGVVAFIKNYSGAAAAQMWLWKP